MEQEISLGLTFENIKKMTNEELVDCLVKQYYRPIPISISTAEDMKSAGQMLAEITNEYSYLMTVLALLKAKVRTLGKDKSMKEEKDDMIGKRDTVEAFVKILSQSYTGLSREISTRQEALKEIQMSKSL
jgi:hypothetical protein